MNITFPRIALVYDRKKKVKKNKKPVMASVEVRITLDAKQKYISTGIMLYPKQWRKGTVENHPQADELNLFLGNMLSNIRKIIMEMSEEGNIDLDQIKGQLKRRERKSMSFIDYCSQRAEIRKYRKEEDTQKRYDRFLRLFKAWGNIVWFEDITDSNIISYDRYLSSQGMKPYSKWNNYHRFLNSFISDAVDDGILQRNPYKWLNIDKDKSSMSLERCLSPEEFRHLRKSVMPTKSLERVRDLFVFQTYTCLRYSDLALFNTKNIVEIKGTKVYKFIQKKTSVSTVIPLLKPALEILDKYNGVLPIISNVKYNEYLKIVAQASGIDKPISTHWARHTGATLLLNEGIDMKIVSKICGHSSARITEQVYAKLLDETVVDAVASLQDKPPA